MICFDVVSLQLALMTIEQYETHLPEPLGIQIIVERDAQGELVAYFGSDIGLNAAGVELPGFEKIRVWVSPDIDQLKSDAVFVGEPETRRGNDWVRLVKSGHIRETALVCVPVSG